METHDRFTGLHGMYGEMALFQLVGRMFMSGGITKKSAGERRDPAGRVADDRADAEREDPDQHQVEGAADHRACDAGIENEI